MAASLEMIIPPLVADDRRSFAELGAGIIAGEIARSVGERGSCALMLAGGSTPRTIYERLAAGREEQISWSKVSVYFGDERCVPPDDPQSNYAMARGSLLNSIVPAGAQVHRMRGEAADPDGAATDYDSLLPGRIDVLVLGMGTDGHIASLFPGQPAAHETIRRVVAVKSPRPPACRLTITPPVIMNARSVIVLVSGPDKAAMVARVLGSDDRDESIPASLARHARWILDPGAASGLSAPGRKLKASE